MPPRLLLVLAFVACVPLPNQTVAQTLISPGGFRGGPTVPVPVGGLTGPGGGLTVEPIKVDLSPTLPLVPTPTVHTDQPGNLQVIPPSTPPEPPADGDLETPEVSGVPEISLSISSAGQGEPEDPSEPPTPSESAGHSSWWVLIAVGLAAVLLYGVRSGGRKY